MSWYDLSCAGAVVVVMVVVVVAVVEAAPVAVERAVCVWRW